LNETADAEDIQEVIQNEGHQCILILRQLFFDDLLLNFILSFFVQLGDITDEVQCERIINITVERFQRIDILVNNAAYQGKRLVS
jgi:NAD(P)-dependent dehydrogenase (short-subunit alcohol dehydrogenase family)